MSDSADPYRSPEAELERPVADGEFVGPRSVPAGHATGWINEGWGYFKRAPLTWVLIVIVWIGGSTLLSMIPGISLIMNLIFPLLIAGIMLGCRALDRGDPIQVGHLFSAFGIEQRLRLLGLGGVYIGAAFAAGIVAAIVFIGFAGTSIDMTDPEAFEVFMATEGFWGVVVTVLVVIALMVPVMMALWFAPLLIAIHDQQLMASLKLSFRGCLKNILPFLVYAILMGILMVIAVIPFGLGMLIVMPIALGAMWASYKDIFVAV